jgi:uncharacterized protein (DUF4415 family)
MARKDHIVRASAEEIQAMRDRGESRSDWQAAERLSHTEVERFADADDGPLPLDWEATVEIGVPEPATPVHIRLDSQVLRWFKANGPGYQTRINAVLRAFVQARQRAEAIERGPK